MKTLTGEAPKTPERHTFERKGLAREAASAERILGMRPDVPLLMPTSAGRGVREGKPGANQLIHPVVPWRPAHQGQEVQHRRTLAQKALPLRLLVTPHRGYADPRHSSKRHAASVTVFLIPLLT